MLADVLTNRS